MSIYETNEPVTVADLLGGDRIRFLCSVYRVVNTPTVDHNSLGEGRPILRFQLDNNSVQGVIDMWAYPTDPAIRVIYNDDLLLAELGV